jgi:hypothetical protein
MDKGCEDKDCTNCYKPNIKECESSCEDESLDHNDDCNVTYYPDVQKKGIPNMSNDPPGQQLWPLAWYGSNPGNITVNTGLGYVLGYPQLYDINRVDASSPTGYEPVPDIARHPSEIDPFLSAAGLGQSIVGFRPVVAGESVVFSVKRLRVPIAPPISDAEDCHKSLQTTEWDASSLKGYYYYDANGKKRRVPVGHKNVWTDIAAYGADAWKRSLTDQELRDYETGKPTDPLVVDAALPSASRKLIFRAPVGVPAPLIKVHQANPNADPVTQTIEMVVLNLDGMEPHSIDFHSVPMDRATMEMSVTGLGTSFTRNSMVFPYQGAFAYHCVGNLSPPDLAMHTNYGMMGVNVVLPPYVGNLADLGTTTAYNLNNGYKPPGIKADAHEAYVYQNDMWFGEKMCPYEEPSNNTNKAVAVEEKRPLHYLHYSVKHMLTKPPMYSVFNGRIGGTISRPILSTDNKDLVIYHTRSGSKASAVHIVGGMWDSSYNCNYTNNLGRSDSTAVVVASAVTTVTDAKTLEGVVRSCYYMDKDPSCVHTGLPVYLTVLVDHQTDMFMKGAVGVIAVVNTTPLPKPKSNVRAKVNKKQVYMCESPIKRYRSIS